LASFVSSNSARNLTSLLPSLLLHECCSREELHHAPELAHVLCGLDLVSAGGAAETGGIDESHKQQEF
jgi:hypothetical protein